MNQSLSSLFNSLNNNRIRYCLLTDYESDLDSNDIDLYVYALDKEAFEEILFKQNWFRRKEPAFHVNHYFYFSPKSEIYLDVKYNPTFAKDSNQGFTYQNYESLLFNPILNSKGIKRPSGLDAIILYTAHLAYKERGRLERKHFSYLSQYIELYRHEVKSGHLDLTEQIKQWNNYNFPGDTVKLQQIIQPYFKVENVRMTRKIGFKYGFGFNILFLGTDGSGKTTMVEAVGHKLNLKNNKLYLGAGESNWTSQKMKRIYNFEVKVKPLNKIFNLFKIFVVLPLEYFIRIAPVFLKSKFNITLIDRFPGSVFIDKKSGRALLYKSILPNPDLVFFLYADPEVLLKRKPKETTLERSRNDIQKFEKVAEIISNGNYKKIDTSDLSINEARDLIISEIFNHPKVYKTLLTTEPCN